MADGSTRRCAIVFNPTKVDDDFKTKVGAALSASGWDAMWLETEADDPGAAMTRAAVEAQVDRVIAAGGDGTVRVVASGLAGTGIPLGVVPEGTGNLLARNLGLPLDQDKALDVALGSRTRTIDLISISADGGPATSSAVIAGMGVDAMIMDETDPKLKATIGSAAYVLAAAKALNRLPMEVTITLDDQPPRRRRAMICAIGNVGNLPGNIALIPDAQPDDGMLDVYVASPRRFTHWLRVLARLVTRRGSRDDRVDQWRARRVTLTLRSPDAYELDGDVAGECRSLAAEIQPGALVVFVPEGADGA